MWLLSASSYVHSNEIDKCTLESSSHSEDSMNLRLSMVLRPSSLMILLAYGALIVLVLLTPSWYMMVTQKEKRVNLNSENIVSQSQLEIEHTCGLLRHMKSSSTTLARFLSLTLDTTNISFSDIQTKVAPLLFQEFETVPFLAQISYIGMEGFSFSYYTDHDQALAMYSNSSSSFSNWGTSNKTLCYIQPVNGETGEVYGEVIATIINPFMNASWIGETVNMSSGFAFLGTKWSNGHEFLFLNSARVGKIGVISLGFSVTDFVARINKHGSKSYLATKDGKVLVEGIDQTHLVISNDMVSFQSVNANGISTSNEGTVSCKQEGVASSLNIRGTQYLIRCYTIDIMGIESVYVLAVPQNEYVNFEMSYKKKELILFIVMMVMIFTALLNFVFINVKATRREMHLCASLIKQMEGTQQAEKKNMNKSIAFASASHDIRASLAGLTGLIEISSELVLPGSELDTNLKQMDNCTQDLLGLLNSILDISKIEAGKMHLEEEEFDVLDLVEDVVDFYHPVAMKKGVDIVLDLCNGSVMRYSRVKGDRGKLKQVLCNLLSNATKFTNEGHVAVRAWAQKPSVQNSIITSNQYGSKKCSSCLFSNKNKAHEHLEPMNSIQQNPHSMDFIFEVDDTGKGIPKENHKSVFENYVQVKETALGQGGTGLGLGIVQSLVRLMHGDIGIVDKDIGEKGTCFRFNVHLTLCEGETMSDSSTRERVEYGSGDINQAQARTIRNTSPGSSFRSMNSRLHIFSSGTKPEASRVVLLIADEERRRISKRFMQSLGIKVKVVKQWKHLFHTLKKIKQKGHHSSGPSSPGSSDLSSRSASHSSLSRASRVALSALDGTEFIIPSVFKKTDIGATPGFVLIVIDANAGPFSELCGIVSNFKKDLHNPCKVVWLDKPLMRSINFKALDQDDFVISKPLHGSRLIQVIKLLPEYGGSWKSNSSKRKRESTHDRTVLKTWKDSRLSKYKSPLMDLSQGSPSDEISCQSVEHVCKRSQQSKAKQSQVHEGEMMQECGDSRCHKPLSGKKFLVVDDSHLLRKLASATLTSLGATIEQCENGEQAVRLVDEGLPRDFPNPPYDYILMDCQMPVMDGVEATEWIRKMEKPYGVRIPIIALTAQTDKITTEVGMDFHIVKPIKRDHLLEAIKSIQSKA
ncbi:hypothetical protein VNO77_13911 [Canavalia gladiata]|uniref:histidine kinase n=1 Tax=Canavalia gladiata TaxID=3824 RepID=A0AAN9M291_CANGL